MDNLGIGLVELGVALVLQLLQLPQLLGHGPCCAGADCDVYLVGNWLARADVVVVADFLLLVPAVLPRLVPALLISCHQLNSPKAR